VLDAINVELSAMLQRVMKDPGNEELLRSIASDFRVLDAVSTAHDLKKHMRKVRAITVDGAVTEHAAKQLQKHGFKVTGDELLRKHLDARGRGIDVDAATSQAVSTVTSGQSLQQIAMLFDATANTPGASGAVGAGGVKFREGLRGPEFDLHLRKTMPNLCGWHYWSTWGFMLGYTGFLLSLVPPLEPLAFVYGGVSLFFDGVGVWCEQS
jgi:hypothetical protein